MARKTIYCAQAFWRRGRRYEAGRCLEFSRPERALRQGERLSRAAPGVAVFSLVGHPDADVWEDPVLLAAFGDVPPLAA